MKEENTPHSTSNSFINLNNYEQWLIMYVDDELSAEEKLAIEKFASAHPHVQQELELFQQTKVQPEELVFPNKEVLYRREKTVRVISIQWLRVAVAAVLVIAAGITFYSIFNKSTDKGITPNGIAKKEQVPASINTTLPTKENQTAVVKDTEQEMASHAVDNEIKKGNEQQEQPKEEIKQQLAYNPTEQPNEPIDETKRVKATTVDINEGPIEQRKMTDAVAIDEKMHIENIKTAPVTNPVVETPDKSSISDDAVQYASNTENKKFRGFFRKATRILERTTSINAADDDKVLIGGMAINLK